MGIWADWSLAELKGFRKELAKAIASGALMVRYADRTIQYRSLDEMRAAATDIDSAIGGLEGRQRVRQVRINSTKGF